MNKEMISMTELNSKYKKKWEDSLVAMEKRDGSLQAVQEKQGFSQLQLQEAQRQLKSHTSQRDDYERRCNNYMQENESSQLQLGNLKVHVKDLEARLRESQGGKNIIAIESSYRKELDKIELHHGLAKEELNRKNGVVSELQNKLVKIKEEYENKLRSEGIENYSKREGAIEAVAEQRVLKAERESSTESYQLRHKNTLLNAKIFELQGTIDVFDSSYGTLKSQYDKIHGHYVKLYNEAKHTVYELERKEHDVNYLKSVMSGTEECKLLGFLTGSGSNTKAQNVSF
jgi:hypothetical protein